VPEEAMSSPNDDAIRRLERRLEALEYAAQSENRWWRGGLIAALVLIALSILIASHRRHHHHWPPPPPPRMMGQGMMGPGMMGGWQQGPQMPYGQMPPNFGYGPGPQGGGWHKFGPPPGMWQHREENAPGPEAPPAPPKQ
jgi:hypothetical protein